MTTNTTNTTARTDTTIRTRTTSTPGTPGSRPVAPANSSATPPGNVRSDAPGSRDPFATAFSELRAAGIGFEILEEVPCPRAA